MTDRYTAREFDESVDWDQMHWWTGSPTNVVRSTLKEPVFLYESGDRCGHETCYETHDQVWIFSVPATGQFFRKHATYNSHDGTQWQDGADEVQAVEVPRTEFHRL